MRQSLIDYTRDRLTIRSDREELAKIFRSLDENGEFYLSLEEIKTGFIHKLGKFVSEDDVEALFTSIDVDQSGFIDYSDFIVAAIHELE